MNRFDPKLEVSDRSVEFVMAATKHGDYCLYSDVEELQNEITSLKDHIEALEKELEEIK